jgi:hypothetical protein
MQPVISGADLTPKNKRMRADFEHRLNRWFQEQANNIGEAIKGKYKPGKPKKARKDDSDPDGDDLQTELLVGGKKLPKIQSDMIRAVALLGWRAINWPGLVEIAQPYLEDAGKEGVDVGIGQVQMVDAGKVREKADQDATEYAAARAAAMAGMRYTEDGKLEEDLNARWPLTEVMRKDLESTVAQAVVEGWTANQLAAVMEGAYALSAERAEIIADTEITNAQSGGTYDAWKHSGTITLVRWTTSPIHDFEDECDSYEAQGVVPLGHEFAEGVFSPRAHPRCRCMLEAVDINEVFAT